MQTNISYYQNKKEFRVFVTKTFSDLIKLKKEGNQASFNALVLKIIPQIRQYINRQLNTAIKKGNFSKNKYKADDFIDQLFIEIYDHIEDVKNEKHFYLWLFKKTNELLEDVIIEEEFDDLFFKNIDDYKKPIWDEMQEKYSTDGGGDLLMIEELDDMSYNHNDYTLNHVFIEDNEKALIEKIDKDLSTKEIQHHITMVVHNLPLAMRNVFELFTNEKLELEEIAQMRNNTLEEVEQLLKEAKKALQVSFFNRYPVN
ncbi:sigma-70 family RNA polymerase sigma factor [Psychroserpens burtonensis]|uniref:Sigma-70 family RNA polymerase sigma factor n=1 Tax=Psychroserpens burtonensis TaxID=49278 RepID=A0A5C7B6F3_9FLAO|nr:sigma-70 family RNA polymerase sigma factor [Psychroserpens burtonensis]TXE16088.1 sigma-70 family RNA polymerase sigma factor [Psychroserpens burtonensis]